MSGGIPLICGVSAIFFGGACWYYLAMPTVNDEKLIQADGEIALKRVMQSRSYTVKNFKTEQVSWKDEPESSSVQ